MRKTGPLAESHANREFFFFFFFLLQSKLLTFLLCSQCPYNNNLQQCFIFLSIPQPMNTTMSIPFLNTLVCARARTCVCVCVCIPHSPLEVLFPITGTLPVLSGPAIICGWAFNDCIVCVCFIQNQIRYRCYKRKSVGSHPVHL